MTKRYEEETMNERFDTFTPPPVRGDGVDLGKAAAAPAEEEAALDPREAAALLEQARRRATRQLDLQPPSFLLLAALTVLVAYGAVWWSVRDQHPYVGPAGWSLGVLYGTLAVWACVTALFLHRATGGVGGRTARDRRLQGVVFAVVWVFVYVFQGALLHAGVAKAVVYGVYPAVAPLIVVGGAAAGYHAAKENRSEIGVALAAVAIGALAAFAGPNGVWGVVGIGLSALLVAYAGVRALQRRA